MNSDTNSNGASHPLNGNHRKRWGRGGSGYKNNPHSAGRGKGQWTGRQNSGDRRSSSDLVGAEGKFIPLGNKTAPSIDAFQQHWRHYISKSDHEVGKFSHGKLQAASTYLKAREVVERTDELFNFKRFFVDYNNIKESYILKERWESIEEELDGNAELVMGIFGLARYELWAEELGTRRRLPFIRARLSEHKPITRLKHLRANFYEKLITLSGTVIRVAAVRPLCTWLTFECCKCLALISVEQPLGRYSQPKQCNSSTGKPCRSFSFTPLRSHNQTLNVDWQLIRLQETLHTEKGRVPRTIECFLTADLCDSAIPGDVVKISGILRTRVASEYKNGFNNSSSFTHSLYIHALSLSNKRNRECDIAGAGLGIMDNTMCKSGYEFTLLDYSTVQEIHAIKSELFKVLVASLCPSIYGHEEVKAGLLLGLFGGSVKFSANSKNKVSVRGNPHILVVGDPGLGKSQMLQSCCSIAPRGILVTATGVTSAGLTVTLTRDKNEFSLEAGALVLADQGTCCIDEFDKMSGHYQALLEAMEQQSISIAKSGITCTLPARTAILAAANPIGGHYNRAKTVAENLKLSPALLSRFDLVFIMIDTPNEESDMFLSEHIMKRHRGDTSNISLTQSIVRSDIASDSGKNSLEGRLRLTAQEPPIDIIPHQLMKIYIAYARRYVFPRLLPEAAEVIKAFYLELRKNHHTADSCPITTRQLESLIRLTEARARLELREEATRQDAEDVVDIARSCLIDTFSDGLGVGNLDFSRAINGSGVSTKSKVKVFVSAMHKFACQQQRNTFKSEEMKQLMSRVGVKVDNFHDFMEILSQQGYFIKKSSGVFQLLSADF